MIWTLPRPGQASKAEPGQRLTRMFRGHNVRYDPKGRLNPAEGPLNRGRKRANLRGHKILGDREGPLMNISFEIPKDIEQQIRTGDEDLSREAKEVYLMEQFRRAKLSHRQLQDALGLSFQETEELLKRRGLGQDIDADAFDVGRERLRKARPR